MRAWLITWEWGNDAGAVADRIAGILNFRLSEDRIERLVEFLYAQATSSVAQSVLDGGNSSRRSKIKPVSPFPFTSVEVHRADIGEVARVTVQRVLFYMTTCGRNKPMFLPDPPPTTTFRFRPPALIVPKREPDLI